MGRLASAEIGLVGRWLIVGSQVAKIVLIISLMGCLPVKSLVGARVTPQFKSYLTSTLTITEDGGSLVLESHFYDSLINAALPCVVSKSPQEPGVQISQSARRDNEGRCVLTKTRVFANLTALANHYNKGAGDRFQKQGDRITVKIPRGPDERNANVSGLFQFIVRIPVIERYTPKQGKKTRISSGDQVLWQYRNSREVRELEVTGRLTPDNRP